jgi:oligoribonuclease
MKKKAIIAGNSICQDRQFLIRHMPDLNAYLNYRMIDVSSIKELVKRWYPKKPRFQKKKKHLALDDIKESIKELAYYRDNFFHF